MNRTLDGTIEPIIPLKTWIAVAGALLGAFLAVLNIQITNASLPYIEGGIGTGGVYGTWISTAYLIGEIIVIPLTDFLSRVCSLRRYLLTNTALFLLFSALCDQAHSLGEMIVFRALQGFTGGVMIPLAFTILITMLPPSKSATQISLLRQGDWIGIALLAVGLAAFQTVLDDGNVYNWFASPFIIKLSQVAAAALAAFVLYEFVTPRPLVNFRLLARRNFGLGTFNNFLLGFALYGSAYLLPQYLAVAQGFNSEQVGEVMAWTGLPQLLVIPLVPFLMKRIDSRLLIVTGLLVFAGSCFMNLYMDQNYAGPQLFWPDVIRAVGQAFVMTPIFANRHDGHRALRGGRRIGPVQHDAQSRRRHRHRRHRDLLYQARAVPLCDHHAGGLVARARGAQPVK